MKRSVPCLALALVLLLGACPKPTPDPRSGRGPAPGPADGVVLVLVSAEDEKRPGHFRYTPVRLFRDGNLVVGQARDLVRRESDNDFDATRAAAPVHDDRYLYALEQTGKASKPGACVLQRLALFGPDEVRIPLATTTCPTTMLAQGGRVWLSARTADRVRQYRSTQYKEDAATRVGRSPRADYHQERTFEERTPGRTTVGELLPPGAPTRAEWFFTSHLTKPNDYLAATDRTLSAVDNMIYPKYAAVYDLTTPGRPRYRYTSQIEDVSPMSGEMYSGAVTTDDALFVRASRQQGGVQQTEKVRVYAITAQGLVPRALVTHQYGIDASKLTEKELEAIPSWSGMIRLGDRLVLGAAAEGLAHVPLTVQGGWRYGTARGGHGFGDDDNPTKGALCDDARGKPGCRQVDLAKTCPACVGPTPRFERFSLGGGVVASLTARHGLGYALVRQASGKLAVVVVSRDPVARQFRIERRVPLTQPAGSLL